MTHGSYFDAQRTPTHPAQGRKPAKAAAAAGSL
jgi:hypothetical protein